MFHLKNSLICFFLNISHNLYHLQISFCADWSTFPVTCLWSKATHTWARLFCHTSTFLPWTLSSMRVSEWAVNISIIHMFLHLSSINIVARGCKFVTTHFFLIRTSHNFIHHKSMKHFKDCTSIIDIVHILNGVFHRIFKHIFKKNIPFLAITKYDTSTLKCLEREEVQCF